MAIYAEKTRVSSEKSRAEIEKTLTRYGASSFLYGWETTRAMVMFKMDGKQVKFILPLPDRNDKQFTQTEKGRERKPKQQEEAYEQAIRQKWRALNLVIKAKLEAVESGITCFEDEFLAHIVLPDGSTVGQFLVPQLNKAYESGRMPEMLPGGRG